MKTQFLPLIATLLAACGGAVPGSTQDFAQSAPSYDQLALTESDVEPSAAAPQDSSITQDATVPSCHPHLFVRTHEIVGRMNRHFRKQLDHVQDLIAKSPTLASGETRTWESVKDGVDRKLTMTRTANTDGSATFAFELDLKTTGDFTKVMSGSLTRSTAETKGSATFDYSALHAVIPAEKATGQVTDTFDNLHDSATSGAKRTASLQLTAFLPEEGDPHGPRNATYSWEREPGVGGKLQFTDSLVLLCPDNPNNLVSDLTTVSRWYKTTAGAVHARSDTKATGGQVPSGDTWQGVTCAQGPDSSQPAEGFWMMKLENAAGGTVVGHADTTGATPCDSALGAVPAVDNNATDYDFSAAVTFPGEF